MLLLGTCVRSSVQCFVLFRPSLRDDVVVVVLLLLLGLDKVRTVAAVAVVVVVAVVAHDLGLPVVGLSRNTSLGLRLL